MVKQDPDRLRRLLLGVASLVIACLALAISWPREKRLMDRATLVTDKAGWDELSGYDWLSDHELLYLPPIPDGDTGEVSKPRIVRYDTHTRAETTLDLLTTRFQNTVDISYNAVFPSPDHTHVFWYGKGDTIYMARMDGTEVQRYKEQDTNRVTTAYWLGDSRHWAEAIDNSDNEKVKSIYLHDLDDPAYHRLLHIDPGAPWNTENFGFMISAPLGSMHLLGENSNPNDEATTDDVIEMDLAVSAKPLHTYRVVLPMSAEIDEVAFSRDGKQIAWILDAKQDPSALLIRLLPRYFKTRTYCSIWVSQIDGSGMREIGHVREIKESTEDNTSDRLDLLDWTPDGKHLSFMYHNSLWTVPAE